MQTLRLRARLLEIVLGLSCALLAPTGFAMEEVTAHGTSADRAQNAQRLEAEIAAYIESVERESKDAIKASLERATAPKLYIALALASNRG